MSLKYSLERLQKHLAKKGDHADVIYDHNKRLTDKIERQACNVCRDGTSVEFFDYYHQQQVKQKIKIDRIMDFTLGTSHNSIGLQVADFYATMCYQHFKKGKPAGCGWWGSLTRCLDRNDQDEFEGFGLKMIP